MGKGEGDNATYIHTYIWIHKFPFLVKIAKQLSGFGKEVASHSNKKKNNKKKKKTMKTQCFDGKFRQTWFILFVCGSINQKILAGDSVFVYFFLTNWLSMAMFLSFSNSKQYYLAFE